MNTVMAFSAEQACVLAGLSMRQLRYWDRTRFFSPDLGSQDRRKPFGRIYSFRDLVGLRAVAEMRNRHQIPLQELRRLGLWLKERYTEPWSRLRFYVVGRQLFFDDPHSGQRLASRPVGQPALPVEMQVVAYETEHAVEELRARKPEQVGRVRQQRFVAHNAPVLAGTRIPTAAVWNFHHAGYAPEAIISEYPRLTLNDVLAAIAFEERRRQKRAS